MFRALLGFTLACAVAGPAPVQDARPLLQIKVTVSEGGQPVAMPRHALLISDDPPTSAPRRVVTGADGTVSVRLRPGRYVVESDEPLPLQGKAYVCTEIVVVTAGRDATLELTDANARSEAAVGGRNENPGRAEVAPSTLMTTWQAAVVGVWSPTGRSTGFVADARGLVVTSQRAMGAAASVQVQLSPERKVPARVLVADEARAVAVLWIDPAVTAGGPVVPTSCARSTPLEERAQVAAISAPLHGPKRIVRGMVSAIEGRVAFADLRVDPGGAGGPVFDESGALAGISSLAHSDEAVAVRDAQVIRVEEVCAAIAAAELKMAETPTPERAALPVEPQVAYSPAAPGAPSAAAANAAAYRTSTSSYDVTFITPTLLSSAAARSVAARPQPEDPRTIDPLEDFANWADYVQARLPVLLVRATPKLAEGFWTRVARAAAQTQGMSLPPIRRFRPGFSRLQAFCGSTEVAPIHPLKIEQRVTPGEAVYEGLYVFAPEAFGPHCGSARLVLYTEKAPQRGETRVLEAALLQRVWDDFAAYRAAAAR